MVDHGETIHVSYDRDRAYERRDLRKQPIERCPVWESAEK
jgi:hypothetical protein